ncbi:MAG: aromatic ring-hydroxylating dioxygenase subunit alpha [Acidimicrobiales bacterium]|nr:aromatic ring-hydroxylating dioxygenase subunit alpha [Acidimicrobiales bacterium]
MSTIEFRDGELTDEAPVGTAIGDVSTARVPTRVPTYHYISPEWAALEMQHVWPKAWQLACTIDHLPEPGDFFEYRVGQLSVLIVRDDAGELRAYQNTCLHRGNVLCTGAGSGLSEIRCPYHRWAWDLGGNLREVPSRRGFGAMRNADYPLIAAQVDTWGPLVFVNLDPGAEPLQDYLDGVDEVVSWADLDDYACIADISTTVPCNWKTLIEAFSETYHVQGIHREMLASCDDVNSVNRLHGRHGSLVQPYGIPSPRIRGGATDQEIWDSIITTQGGRYGHPGGEPGPHPPVPDGGSIRDVLERLVRERAAAQGWDIGHLTQSQAVDLFQLNLFPNITVIVLSDAVTVLRARPGATPDDAHMDVIRLERTPPGHRRGARPFCAEISPDDAQFGLVFDQDVVNLSNAQRGLHQPGLTHILLSREEMRIMNLHRNLEQYIGIDSELNPEAVVEIDHLRRGG